jgi:hypothetical protein
MPNIYELRADSTCCVPKTPVEHSETPVSTCVLAGGPVQDLTSSPAYLGLRPRFRLGIPRRGVQGCAFPGERSTLSRPPFDGARPIVTESVACSALSPVNGAFPPGRAGRFDGAEYRSASPRQGIQPAGYRHSRPARGPGRGGVVRRRHRICHHARSQSEALVPLKTAFLNEGTLVLPSTVACRIKLVGVSPPYCAPCPLRGLRYSLRAGPCPVCQVTRLCSTRIGVILAGLD